MLWNGRARGAGSCPHGHLIAGRQRAALEAAEAPDGIGRATAERGRHVEAAGDGGITHIECPALDLSAATATRREIGKGGGWGFGGENSSPIEAAGLALLGLTISKRNPKRKAKVT